MFNVLSVFIISHWCFW